MFIGKNLFKHKLDFLTYIKHDHKYFNNIYLKKDLYLFKHDNWKIVPYAQHNLKYFFFFPTISIDDVLQRPSVFKMSGLRRTFSSNNLIFRLKPGYILLWRHLRNVCVAVKKMKFYRQCAITNWVRNVFNTSGAAYWEFDSRWSNRVRVKSPVNNVYNWKYSV